MILALVRAISPRIESCELSHLERTPIDLQRATWQHARYLDTLRGLGCRVEQLPPLPDSPDGVFVEDTAVVLDELAVIARPGALSRRAETASVAEALRPYRPLAWIGEPGTLDGGDVLRSGRTLFVGMTARTDAEGARQLARAVLPAGYRVHTVAVSGCLHLKSAATEVAEGTLLLNPAWVDSTQFPGRRLIHIDPAEPFAANALRVGDAVLHAAEFPRTGTRLDAAGIRLTTVEAGELAKAEGGVTCCSIVLNRPG